MESLATSIVYTLQRAGHLAYFVGGWVRDCILKRPASDIDIATSATPIQVMELFPKTVSLGLPFGILGVVEQGYLFEVAMLRTDLGSDGRRPKEIRPASLQSDVQRRDLTINGLFYDPLRAQLIDLVGGWEDIERGLLRSIGIARDRLREDKLRILRALRYAHILQFQLDQELASAIERESKELRRFISKERIWQELQKMSSIPRFDKALYAMESFGLLKEIFPQVTLEDIDKSAEALAAIPAPTPLELQMLVVLDMANASLENWCAEWGLGRVQLRKLVALREWRKRSWARDSDWIDLYAERDVDLLLPVICAGKGDDLLAQHRERAKGLQSTVQRRRKGKPILPARFLIAKGISGKSLGEALAAAERIAVDEKISSSDRLLLRLEQLGIV